MKKIIIIVILVILIAICSEIDDGLTLLDRIMKK